MIPYGYGCRSLFRSFFARPVTFGSCVFPLSLCEPSSPNTTSIMATILPFQLTATSTRRQAQLHLWGSPKASQLVICCPGFPDDPTSMAPLAKRLVKDTDSFVGVVCLPGYDHPRDAPDGYSYDEWATFLNKAIELLVKNSSSSSASETKQIAGIFHDWGVIAGLLYQNQHQQNTWTSPLLDRIILLDVMPQPHPECDIPPDIQINEREIAQTERYLKLYQFALALNFWLFKNTPKYLVVFFQAITEMVLTFFHCFPVSPSDYQYLRQSGLLPVTLENCLSLGYKSYPYTKLPRNGGTIFNVTSLPKNVDRILFLYGGSKWISLHHSTSFQLLKQQQQQQQDRAQVHCIPEAGHWLHCTHLDECWPVLKDFMLEKKKKRE